MQQIKLRKVTYFQRTNAGEWVKPCGRDSHHIVPCGIPNNSCLHLRNKLLNNSHSNKSTSAHMYAMNYGELKPAGPWCPLAARWAQRAASHTSPSCQTRRRPSQRAPQFPCPGLSPWLTLQQQNHTDWQVKNSRNISKSSKCSWAHKQKTTFRDGLAVPGDGIDKEATEAGERLGSRPPGVVVVGLGAPRVDDRDDAVLAPGVQEHPVHRVLAGAAKPEVEIWRRRSVN